MHKKKQHLILMVVLLSILMIIGCSKRHVVLICGDKAENGFPEFWCDTARMYDIFRRTGVSDADIHLLYGDGNDWTCPNNPAHNHPHNITDHSATIANVTMVFNRLAAKIRSRDKLIVWTFDHGASNGSLCLMDGYMSPATFSNLVGAINCKGEIYMMQQCFSGDFISPLAGASNKRVIITAAGHEFAWPANDSWENNNPCRTGEFNYYLMNALERMSPDRVNLSACDVTGDGNSCCIEVKYNIFSGDGQPNPGGEGTKNECAGMNTPSTPQYSSPGNAFDNLKITSD